MSHEIWNGSEHDEITEADCDVCLVCLENISPKQAVWSCAQCFDMTHLGCIQSWIAKRDQRNLAGHERWSCPKCRAVYDSVPRKYLCFCGKEDLGSSRRNGDDDGYVAPHSCGEICGKTLVDCKHKCAIPCHRSACPQCTRMLMCVCWCGASKSMQRCGKTGFACGGVCGKSLSCGHSCPQPCHQGACPPCLKSSVRSCQCGGIPKVDRPCALGPIDCGKKVCGGVLSCGYHKCERGCHAPPCALCPEMGRRTCPCGATQYSMVCNDTPPPKCKNSCGKKIACGHVCSSLCHDGPCECARAITKACRCGSLKKQGVMCGSELLCSVKCNRDRECGKHKCRRKCCPGVDCPPCTEICGGHLACGNHKCEAHCHKGPCQPCTRKVQIPCACGQTILRVDCGRESLVAPPKCKFVCSYQVCHHKPSHQCHFGPCPPCKSSCGKVYDECGHPDIVACHDPHYPLVPKLPVFKQGEIFRTRKEENFEKETIRQYGPRVPLALSCVECGPCMTVVKRECVGKHGLFDRICSSLPSFSCEASCGTLLHCTHHKCPLPCHAISSDGSACQQCSEQCAHRYPGCGHRCPLPCHPASIPHPVCASSEQCAHRYPGCNHRCPLTCHPASIPHPVCASSEQCAHRYAGCGHQCPLTCHPASIPHPVCESSEQCSFRYRICGHQCPLTCHPASVPHPPCPQPLAVICHCGHTTTMLKCFESTNRELIERVRACPAQCPKNLACGFHRCTRTCHDVASDPCEAICTKRVAVTCPCRSTKGVRMACDEVVGLRRKKGIAYDSPAVLDCGEACAVKNREQAEAQRQRESEEEKARLERRKGNKRGGARTDDGGKGTEKVPPKSVESPLSSIDVLLRIAVLVVILLLVWLAWRALSQ